MAREYFRVLDCANGNLDFLTITQIASKLKVSDETVAEYVDMDKKLKNRYMIHSLEFNGTNCADVGITDAFEKKFKREWDSVCKKFHENVKWVKSGGRRLIVTPSGLGDEDNGEETQE